MDDMHAMNATDERLTRRRWLILAVICLINLCAGSIYAWSVLASAAAAHFTAELGTIVTPGDLAVAFGVANAVGPIPMILGGAVNDRFGPRAVIMGGGLLIGLGLVLCGMAASPSSITLAYGGCFGLGLGLTYGACITTAIRYFPDRRGMAGGIVTAAYGMSSVLVPPVAQQLIEAVGIMNTFMVLGCVFGAVIMTGALACRRCPPDFVPVGMQQVRSAQTVSGKTWREMLASPIFYPMIVLLLCGALSGMMIISQAASIAKNNIGMGPAAAAAAVSVIALFNMAGRLAAGMLSDRLGRLAVLMTALVLSACGLGVLMTAGTGDNAAFYLGCVLVGLSFGAFMAIYPGFTADRFGTAHTSVNYGIMFCGFAAAGFGGPTLMREMQAAGMDFAACCMMALGFCVVGLMTALVCRIMMKKSQD